MFFFRVCAFRRFFAERASCDFFFRIYLQLLLFLLMLSGFMRKAKAESKDAEKYLTDLLLEVFCPDDNRFLRLDVSGQLLLSSLEVLGVSFAVLFFCLLKQGFFR